MKLFDLLFEFLLFDENHMFEEQAPYGVDEAEEKTAEGDNYGK